MVQTKKSIVFPNLEVLMELEEWLINEDKLKERLLSYPGTSEEMALNEIEQYKDRLRTKKAMLENFRYDNWMVEQLLERKYGYPRPPGWKHVFFIPDSYRPRGSFFIVLVIIFTVLIFSL